MPREVDGLLDVMDDAVVRAADPLTHDRLRAWQAALFPTGCSGMVRIAVGAYRAHAGPMQIVSGRAGHETVHSEAPPSADVPVEMTRFLEGIEGEVAADALVKAALAHLWFETIHPFEDGNGRVGRAVIDLPLGRDAGESSRFVRISQQLLLARDDYDAQLERARHGPLDVTPWVAWFAAQVKAACEAASDVFDPSLVKARFWDEHRGRDLTPRQRKVMNVLLDAGPGGFEGGMSARKYPGLASTSGATASRALAELAELGLRRPAGAGRSTRYHVDLPGWSLDADRAAG